MLPCIRRASKTCTIRFHRRTGKKSIQDPSLYSNDGSNVHVSDISPTQNTHYKQRNNNEIFTGTSNGGSSSDNTMLDMSSVANLVNNGAVGGGGGVVVEKRASPSGFMGMRGKKPYYYTQPWNGIYQPDGLKRAPSGFFGMRGKRDWETVDYGKTDFPTKNSIRLLCSIICFSCLDAYQKRAPSGFFGMRGKKPDSYGGPVGFVGMRGKKYYDQDDVMSNGGDDFPMDADKRAPSGFFGVRGKKQPGRSGFFGMRGKKYPYEFRGKFVGVRGKKMYANDDDDFQRFGDNLDINQLMLLLTEQNNGYGDGLMDSPTTTYYDSNDVQQ